jgi:hypothetical protein
MRTHVFAALAGAAIAGFAVCARAEAEGTLTVQTDPDGIEVWLDDKYLGDTPIMDKKLKAGRYTVKLVDPIQHTSMFEEVLIQPDKSTVIEKTMKGKFGSLKVGSAPEAADVYLLTSLGKTPLANDFMNPGKYRVEIRHPNKRYAPVSQDIVIPRGETVTINKTLEKTSPFDLKAFVRLALGAGAIAGFVWAIVEQGQYKKFDTLSDPDVNTTATSSELQKKKDNAHGAAVQRTFGIILGSACVVGFEIVAFF